MQQNNNGSKAVIEEVTSSAQLDAFLAFPFTLYAASPHWVPPVIAQQQDLLSPLKNPFFSHGNIALWTASEQGQVVGRIAGIVDFDHIRVHEEPAGFFGFFECVNNPEIASELLETVSEWLRAQGLSILRGPVSPSLNHECGVLISGFDGQPRISMPYSQPYYDQLLKQCGFEESQNLIAYWHSLETPLSPRLQKFALNISAQDPVRVEQFGIERASLPVLLNLYNRCWRNNFGFLPISLEEFTFLYEGMKDVIDPRFCLIASLSQTIDGQTRNEPVGFALAIPDLNPFLATLRGKLSLWDKIRFLFARRKAEALRLLLAGVVPEHQSRGVGARLGLEIALRARRAGFRGVEVSWVLEGNLAANKLLADFGCTSYRRYRLYMRNNESLSSARPKLHANT